MSADAAARREIVERLDATMLVEAGAGTGKTRALVDRVVALVARGTPIERIAAITFTERAAAELRERVRDGLEERAAAPDADPAVAERCRTALGDLDRAQLSTIHSFGQGLLRTLAAEAGIDPDMTVLDQLTAERRFEERWRAALEEVDADGAEGRALDVALGRGLTLAGLRTLAMRLAEREDIAALLLASPPSAPAPDWEELAGLRAALAGAPPGPGRRRRPLPGAHRRARRSPRGRPRRRGLAARRPARRHRPPLREAPRTARQPGELGRQGGDRHGPRHGPDGRDAARRAARGLAGGGARRPSCPGSRGWCWTTPRPAAARAPWCSTT